MFFISPHKVFLIIPFLFYSIISYSQDTLAVKASVDKSQLVIGEQIHFTLEAHFPSHEPIRFFSIDTIPHFEILQRQKIDTSDNGEAIELKQIFTLTSFDSGHWVIPSFELTADKPLSTDTIPVDVGFSPFDPKQDYHDIKDVIDVKAEEKKNNNLYWMIAASAVLLGLIIYFLVRKKKPVKPVMAEIDPYKEAMLQLENLKKEKLDSKLFYTRLVDIFRLYISRRKGIASQQKTTDDLVPPLRALQLPAETFNQLTQALLMSDFVKFAKYEPAEADKTASFGIIKNCVEIIEKTSSNTTTGGGPA
jgi:hypothetical protein